MKALCEWGIRAGNNSSKACSTIFILSGLTLSLPDAALARWSRHAYRSSLFESSVVIAGNNQSVRVRRGAGIFGAGRAPFLLSSRILRHVSFVT
jgi:hypothetical protein